MKSRRRTPVLLWMVALVACGAAIEEGERSLHGTPLGEPLPRPDFVLTDTRGEPFDFRRETDGDLTLLFFGYTHCPDVCPVHMGAIAAALEDLGWQARDRIQVVFVTTDPGRDTPERIRAWLDRFDRDFTGLRGTPEEIAAIQRRLGLPESAVLPPPPGSGPDAYLVGHAAQVIAFSPDGPARVVYPFGTRQQDWSHDLPLLLES